MYTSGSIVTWTLAAIAYFAFGTYTFLKKEYLVTAGQYTGGIFSMIIILQYLFYPHAG
ncbi:MAG: hypothetical protein AAB490_03235 [Patescibacteria group bacterium]